MTLRFFPGILNCSMKISTMFKEVSLLQSDFVPSTVLNITIAHTVSQCLLGI